MWIIKIIICLIFISCSSKTIEHFNDRAQKNYSSADLHLNSSWSYLTREAYAEMMWDGVLKLDPPILAGESVFELGMGVGAALRVIAHKIPNLKLGGSDFADKAIEKAKQVLPEHAPNFFVHDMTKKHQNIADNNFDHVVSFGALAMYLNQKSMRLALSEALRITKPGGSLVVTHFCAPKAAGWGVLERISQDDLHKLLTSLGAVDIKFYPMKNTGDLYQVAFRKPG